MPSKLKSPPLSLKHSVAKILKKFLESPGQDVLFIGKQAKHIRNPSGFLVMLNFYPTFDEALTALFNTADKILCIRRVLKGLNTVEIQFAVCALNDDESLIRAEALRSGKDSYWDFSRKKEIPVTPGQ